MVRLLYKYTSSVGALATTIAIAGLLVAMATARDPIERVLKQNELYLLTWHGYDALDLILILGLIISVLVAALFFLSPVLERLVFTHSGHKIPVPELCSAEDLVDIDRLSSHEFGDRSSNLDQILRLYEYSPASFWKITTHKMCGYFIIYGLKKAGERAILEGAYNGANPAREHIAKSFRRCRAVCIGAAVGSGWNAKASVVIALNAMLTSGAHKRVYAKPVTADGFRLVKGRGFKCIKGGKLTKNVYCVREVGPFSAGFERTKRLARD